MQHPLLETIVDWARDEAELRALVLTGSRARADGSVDAYSDLDLQVITNDSRRYTEDDSWLEGLGELWIRFPLDAELPYRLVWFAGGVKVDFQFIPPSQIRAQRAQGMLSAEYQRGYRVLVDKDGLLQGLPPSPHVFPLAPAPSPEELLATINEFWFEALHVAQYIRRREFWVVKFRDWTMKQALLQLLEWRAQLLERRNTWLLGRRILQWSDAEAAATIPQLWAGWDAAQLWQSLRLQLALFLRLSHEVCAACSVAYDEAAHRAIQRAIHELQAQDDGD